MKVLKNNETNVIIVTDKENPDGYSLLGTDDSINDSNKSYVTGFENGAAVFGFIDQLKNSLLEKNKALHEKAIATYFGVIMFDGVEWDSSEKHLRNCNSELDEITKGTSIPPVQWMNKNNNIVELSESELIELKEKIATDLNLKGKELYQTKWSYREQINSSTTIDELNAIELIYE